MPTKSLAEYWDSIRHSKKMVIAVVFVAMMLDLMMNASLDPILPDMLYRLDSCNISNHQQNASKQGGNTTVGSIVYSSKSTEIGIILAIKPATEIFANVIVGYVVDRFGHRYPLLLGCLATFVANIGFAFGQSLSIFIIMRLVQAFGSSLSVVAGLALLATVFTEDSERVKATNIAFIGVSIGISLGFPLGSILYQFLGKEAPFLVLAALTLVDSGLRLVIKVPDQNKKDSSIKTSGYKDLLMDPYIFITLGCICMLYLGLGIKMTVSPAWMLDKLKAEQWQIGVILLVGCVFQGGTQYFSALLAGSSSKRWIFCVIGLLLFGVGMILYPFCNIIWEVIGPETMVSGFGAGITLGVVSPLLGYLVDMRHTSNYGAVYGLYGTFYNAGFIVGPLCGGVLLQYIGFDWLNRGTGIIIMLYSSICMYLKRLEKLAESSSKTVCHPYEKINEDILTETDGNKEN